MNHPSRRGLTLVELLAAIAIVGIVLTMLLPAVQQGREAARKLVCRHHLQQIGLALHNYHDRSRCLPYGWDTHGSLWTAHLLPFLEQGPLYDTLVFPEQGAAELGGRRAARMRLPAALFWKSTAVPRCQFPVI